jgi:hypothetical protein
MAGRDPGDMFSYAELAMAGGISKSAYQHLSRSGFLPGGRSIRDFKRVAAIGAFMAGGMTLMSSAGIAKTIVEMEFNEADGEAPSGLQQAALLLNEETLAELSSGAREWNDYWSHYGLWRQGWLAGVAKMRADALIEIVDRRYVFVGSESGLKSLNWTGEAEHANLIGWLEGWQRGLEPRLVHIAEQLTPDRDDRVAVALFKKLNAEAQSARDHAVGMSIVNISLAIRRAFDRLQAHRQPRETHPILQVPTYRRVSRKENLPVASEKEPTA